MKRVVIAGKPRRRVHDVGTRVTRTTGYTSCSLYYVTNSPAWKWKPTMFATSCRRCLRKRGLIR